MMRGLLRSKEMVEKYQAHKASGIMERVCVLCVAKELQDFKYWRIIKNDFPYDKIAEVHHMIVPKRHVHEIQVSSPEWEELQEIKSSTLQDYDIIVEGTKRVKSIPQHFHLHIIKLLADD